MAINRNIRIVACAVPLVAAVTALAMPGTLLSTHSHPNHAESPATQDQDDSQVINFSNAPWNQVLQRIADRGGMTLIMEKAPDGQFTYYDERPRSTSQAIDLLNRVLLPKGFLLVRNEKLLIVASATNPVPPSLVQMIEPDELSDYSANEFASITIQLEHTAPDTYNEDIEAFRSTMGTVQAVPRTKQLIVTDLVRNLQKITSLVKKIDSASKPKPTPKAAPKPDPKTAKLYELRRTDSESMKKTLTAFFGSLVSAEIATPKKIVVNATDATHPKVADLIEQVEKPVTGSNLDQVHRLKYLTAEQLATSFQLLYPIDSSTARFSADTTNNVLIVSAPESVQTSVKNLLKSLDLPPGGSTVVRSYTPQSASITALRSLMQSLFPESPTLFAIDLSKRRLLITATAEMHDRISEMLAEIDQEREDAGPEAHKVIRLKHASASTLVETLQKLYPPEETSVRLSADVTNNLLIIIASQTAMARIESVVSAVDVSPDTDRLEKIYTPVTVPATTVFETLNQLYGDEADTSISLDPSGRNIIIVAPDAIQNRVQQLMLQLDRMDEEVDQRETQIYRLRYGIASELLSPLQSIYSSDQSRVQISTNSNLNALIVVAPEDSQKRISALIEQLDKPSESQDREDRVYTIKNVSVSDVQSSLQDLYENESSFVVNESNGTLIVRAAPELQKRIAEMITQLDIKKVVPADQIHRIYRLKFADPTTLAGSIESLYSNRTDVRLFSDTTNQNIVVVAPAEVQKSIAELVKDADSDNLPTTQGIQRVYFPKHVRATTIAETLSQTHGNTSGVTIQADPQGRSVIITAPALVHDRVNNLITLLDQPAEASRVTTTRVYRLNHAQSSSVMTPLQSLFENSPVAVQLTADTTNNTLIATATTTAHAQILSIVKEIDQPATVRNQSNRVYVLQHANPSSVLDSLKSLYPDDARFVVDLTNRAIIASASDEIHARIEELIEQLDQPKKRPDVSHRIYRMRSASYSAISSALQTMFQSREDVQILPDSVSGSVIVIAPEDVHKTVTQVVSDAENPKRPDKPTGTVQYYQLRHISRDTVQSAIGELFDIRGIKFLPGAGSKTLIVVASAEDHVRVAKLVSEIDKPDTTVQGKDVRVFYLSQLDPYSAASAAADLFSGSPTSAQPYIESESEPDRLIVRGTSGQITAIQKLLNQLGEKAESDGSARTIRTIRVHEGSPRALAETIENVWPRLRKNPIRIVVSSAIVPLFKKNTNPPIQLKPKDQESLPGDASEPVLLTTTPSRLIAASQDTEALDLIEQLARSLSEIPDDDQGEFTVFQLETASASEVAQTINEAFNGPDSQNNRTQLFRRERVRVVANDQTNSLLVRASPVDLLTVQRMVESLDRLETRSSETVHIVPLKQASASEVTTILQGVYQNYIDSSASSRSRRTTRLTSSVSISADTRSNSVVISAPDNLFKQMEVVIKGLDSAARDSRRNYKVLPLKKSDSTEVRDAIDILLQRSRGSTPSKSSRSRRSRQRSSSTSNSQKEPVASSTKKSTSVTTYRFGQTGNRADPTNSALLGFDDGETRIMQVGYAQTDDVDQSQLSDDAEVDSLAGLNVILLWGSDNDIEIMTEVVEQIEQLSNERRLTFQLVPLRHVKARRIADLVDELYSSLVNSRGGAGTIEQETKIIPLSKPNALLLAASQSDLVEIVGLAQDLDQPVSADSQFRTFHLAHASAEQVEATITDFFNNREQDGELAVEVVVTADSRSNSLVVMAAPRDMSEVDRLVKELDTEMTATLNDLRIFSLKNSQAEELAQVLNEAIAGSSASNVGAARLRLVRPDSRRKDFVESGILEHVRITANANSNTLIVSAPTRNIGLISELIRQLDVPPQLGGGEIKVFTLENSDAARMALTLQTLASNVEVGGGAIGAFSPDDGDSPFVSLNFAVDDRTNSLLISGSPTQLEVVEAIIIRLDGSDVTERESSVYKLKNSSASAVAGALNQFLQSQLLQELQQAGVVSPSQLRERDVVVVPEEVSNSVLISAVPRVYPEILKLIKQLDEAPSQVVIQVLIAQVNLTDDEEFGIELGIQDSLLFRRGIFPGTASIAPPAVPLGVSLNSTQTPAQPGFNFNNQPLGQNPNVSAGKVGAQALSNFALGRVGPNGFGGLVLSAASENISILLRALKAQGRLEVLSRPQVVTLDNQEAYIQVGQKVPIVTNSVITANGSVVNPVEFTDVGIILLVTPKINPDGTVVMRVGPEISALSPEQVEISSGTFAPIIDTTRAETTVSARDGQTVIIGGLITKIDFNETRTVPFLGDIPIIKWAFRSDRTDNDKRELLILLTPHIVRNSEEAEMIKRLETQRMDWTIEKVREIHGTIEGVPEYDHVIIDSENMSPEQPDSFNESTRPRTLNRWQRQQPNAKDVPAPPLPDALVPFENTTPRAFQTPSSVKE